MGKLRTNDFNIFLIDKMKRSLAPPRRDKPAGSANNQNNSSKKLPLRGTGERGPSK